MSWLELENGDNLWIDDGDDIKSYDEPTSKTNNGGATNVASPSYEALVDQIKQNNAWSAEQAQKQMDFQEKAWREQMEFNALQAQANRDFQQESANVAMNFSAEEAQKNRDWQEMMSNSAHQREMADLEKAGLNPILAARNGASTGTGASAVSAQAAGSQASSVSTPQGAKGNTDESGTMAIMSLLSRMLDNQIEREKMQNSAEIAFGTADIYTAATRYAAELAQIASIYGSNRSYDASMNNLEHILGNFVNEWMDSNNFNGYSAANLVDNVVDSVSNSGLIHRVKDTVSKVKDYFGKIGSPSGKVDSKVGGTTTSGSHNGSHSSGKF